MGARFLDDKKMEKVYGDRIEKRMENNAKIQSLEAFKRGTLSGAAKIRSLTDKQRMAIDLLSDFVNCWSYQYVAEKVGVTMRRMNQWRNDSFFIKQLDIAITKKKTMMRREAFRHFFKRIKKGDARAIRDYFKMSGDLKENIVLEDHNLDSMPEAQLDLEIAKLSGELGIELEITDVDGTGTDSK